MFTGTVIFQDKMLHVDMVGFISGFHDIIGATWEDPCAENTEQCGKRYAFNFQPPPIAGIFNLEILLLCNFNKNTSVYERSRRLLYDAPVNIMTDMSISTTQQVGPISKNFYN